MLSPLYTDSTRRHVVPRTQVTIVTQEQLDALLAKHPDDAANVRYWYKVRDKE